MEQDPSTQVLSRSEVYVAEHEYGFKYMFEVNLEDGRVLLFEGFANTAEKASANGTCRSEKMIEKGYQDGM